MLDRKKTKAIVAASLLAVLTACDAPSDDDGIRPLAADLDDEESERIYGGQQVAACGWPSTVSLGGSCTGTLVHPSVVVYAAHCGASYSKVRFGEYAYGGAGRQVNTQYCKTHPNGQPGGGRDFAYCVLQEPVDDVPIVPILMGCELDELTPGSAVTLVGFGNADNGPYGYKREVTTTFHGITSAGEAFIGGGGKDTCQGDSGGPAFIQLDDGSWRVFGVTSYGGACGGGGYDSVIPFGIEWFESNTGIDLTPCHDVDGTWNPSAGCGAFPLQPAAGGGTWASGCGGGPVSGASATCGDPSAAAGGDAPIDQSPPSPTQQAQGSLSGTGSSQVQPASGWYQAPAGLHRGVLSGPANADFDLYLYKYVNNSWVEIGRSTLAGSNEQVEIDSNAGYFAWLVHSYQGGGAYSLTMTMPQ